MPNAKEMLDSALNELEATVKLERYDILPKFGPVAKAAKELAEHLPELEFEQIAADLVLYDKPSVWGTNFGPWASGLNKSGERVDSPPLQAITPECIEYWKLRMSAAKHPVLSGRYADLVWDLSPKITGKKPPIETAQIAIGSYVDAVTEGRCEQYNGSADIAERALNLAASINDATRLQDAVTKLTNFSSLGKDDATIETNQRHLFQIFLRLNKRRPEPELAALAASLRVRLQAMTDRQADHFSHELIALPLADYYRSIQKPDEAKIVLHLYGTALIRMSGKAMPVLAAGWLQQLYALYLRYEMNGDAADVLRQIEAVQPKVPENLAQTSIRHEVKADELDKWLDWLISDNFDESVLKIVDQFLPSIANEKQEIAELQKKHRLLSMFTTTIVGHDGRAVARIEGDDGKLVQHIKEDFSFNDLFLAKAFERLISVHQLNSNKLMTELVKSPVWHPQRHEVLKRAVEAFFANDHISTIHILVSEIESAIRSMAKGLGISLQKPNRMGGFNVKNLGDFLSEELLESCLTADVITYLRILLTDLRGTNLRNNTCHGLLPATSFNGFHSRRLMHVVLLLGLIRKAKPNEDFPPDSDESPGKSN